MNKSTNKFDSVFISFFIIKRHTHTHTKQGVQVILQLIYKTIKSTISVRIQIDQPRFKHRSENKNRPVLISPSCMKTSEHTKLSTGVPTVSFLLQLFIFAILSISVYIRNAKQIRFFHYDIYDWLKFYLGLTILEIASPNKARDPYNFVSGSSKVSRV